MVKRPGRSSWLATASTGSLGGALAFALALPFAPGAGCGGAPGPNPDAAVQAVPLIVYSSCGAERGPKNQWSRCVYVKVSSAGLPLIAEWTICGSSVCDVGQGYGAGPIGPDGKSTRPALFRCLPDRGQPITVDICAPGYRPLSITMPPDRLAKPLALAVAQRNLEACSPDAPDVLLVTDDAFEVTYELTPFDAGAGDGGVDTCPLLPDAGAPPPAFECPCPR